MRLLLVNYEWPPLGGGGGVACSALAQSLLPRDWSIQVVTSAGTEDLPLVAVEDGVEVHRVPVRGRASRAEASMLSMASFILAGPRYVKRERERFDVDVVNTHFAIPTGPAGAKIARTLGRPNVLALHGGEIFRQPLELEGYRNPLIRLIVRRIIHRADAVVAQSTDTRRGAERHVGTRCPIEILPYGIDPPRDIPPSPPRACLPERPRIVTIGRLVPRKGFDVLIGSLGRLRDLDWRLRVIGDGSEKPRLVEEARTLGIEDRIEFLNFLPRDEFWARLMESDLFALATWHEGLGLVYHEAMYAALPIVTTDNGGQTDFLSDPDHALLAPVGDEEAIARALRRSLTDEGWYAAASRRNAEDIRSLTMERLGERWDAFFRRVVDREGAVDHAR